MIEISEILIEISEISVMKFHLSEIDEQEAQEVDENESLTNVMSYLDDNAQDEDDDFEDDDFEDDDITLNED